MTDEEAKRLHLSAQLDQFGAAMASLAPVAAQYYHALIAAGLSPDVALSLLRDWHECFWQATMKGQQP